MSEEETQQPLFSDPQDAEVTQYRAVSGLAVAGLIVGLLAPVALAHPVLWSVPAAGIVLGVVALWRIARHAPALIGRKAALVGLVLSVLCGAIAPSEWFTYRRLVDREGRQFATQWFEFLRRREVHNNLELSQPPRDRRPLDEELWEYYSPGTDSRDRLEGHVQRPEIRSMLTLGQKARSRYYDTEEQSHTGGNDVVTQVYAVTYQEGGQKKSFFVRLVMTRYRLADTGRAYWQVMSFRGGIRPNAMGGDEEGQGS